ncbi:50S ribosomal protein L29 [Malacoplasma muris]|uniref:50S ribosomal protein L29 n=1 Tax=Malacoplasma muris TaxID=2119 RepID=UPI00398EDA2A
MIKDLRKKTDIELGELISSLKVQLLEYRFKMANGDVEGIHKISEIKKMIATAMTVLSERNIKISFTTHTVQLIKISNNKQDIKAIKLESLAKEVSDKKSNKQAKTTPKTNKKPIPNKTSNKVISKDQKNSNVSKQSASSNIKSSSNNRQKKVAIRRTAKG